MHRVGSPPPCGAAPLAEDIDAAHRGGTVGVEFQRYGHTYRLDFGAQVRPGVETGAASLCLRAVLSYHAEGCMGAV